MNLIVKFIVFGCCGLLSREQSIKSDDLVSRLMGDTNYYPQVALQGSDARTASRQLQVAQKTATGTRAQQIAFLLAALGSDYVRNRNYLVDALRQCGSKSGGDCDEDTRALLIRLYRLGHTDVLRSLVSAGPQSDGALAELLGSFYSQVLADNARTFMKSADILPVADRAKVCSLAGGGDGSGLDTMTETRIRKSLGAIGKAGASCLTALEVASRHAKSGIE